MVQFQYVINIWTKTQQIVQVKSINKILTKFCQITLSKFDQITHLSKSYSKLNLLILYYLDKKKSYKFSLQINKVIKLARLIQLQSILKNFMTSFDRSLKPIPNKLIGSQPPQLISKQYNFSPKSPYNRQVIPQLVKYNLIQKQKKNKSPTHFNVQDQQNLSQQLYDNEFLLLDRSFVQSQYISKNEQNVQQQEDIIDNNIKFSFGGQNSNNKIASNIQKIEEQILNKYKKTAQNKNITQNQQKNNQKNIKNSSRFPKNDQGSSENIFKSNKNQFNLNLLEQKKQITLEQKNNFSQPYDMQLNLQDSRTQNQQIQYINDQILNTIYTANFRNKQKNYNFLTHEHTANSIDISSIQNNNQKNTNTSVNPLHLLHYSLLHHNKPTFIQDQAYKQNQNQSLIRQNRSLTENNPKKQEKQSNFINQEDRSHIQWMSNTDLNKSQPNPYLKNNPLRKQQSKSGFFQHNKGDYIQESKNQKKQYQNNNKLQQKSQIPRINHNEQKDIELQKMSLSLFTYYLGNKLQNVYSFSQKININRKKNQVPNDLYESYLIEQDHQEFNQIHINQFIPSKQFITNPLTSRSTPPINNNTTYSSPYKILDKSYQTTLSGNYFSNHHHEEENFILDKKPQQIISSIMTNRQKMKLYLKYLQCQIAKCDQNQGNQTKKVYQILSCLLIKLNSVNQKSTNQRQNILVQNIIKMFDKKPKQKVNNQISLKPTISLSQKGMKIQFDTYMSHKKKFMNERISYLKGLLQQKKNQEQLIKLSYDQIIHDYAQSLSNVAKSKHINSTKYQNLRQEHVKSTFSEPQENQQNLKYLDDQDQNNAQNMTSSKIFEMEADRNSLSLNHKMYRKATFGKAPSSMRNSNQNEQI